MSTSSPPGPSKTTTGAPPAPTSPPTDGQSTRGTRNQPEPPESECLHLDTSDIGDSVICDHCRKSWSKGGIFPPKASKIAEMTNNEIYEFIQDAQFRLSINDDEGLQDHVYGYFYKYNDKELARAERVINAYFHEVKTREAIALGYESREAWQEAHKIKEKITRTKNGYHCAPCMSNYDSEKCQCGNPIWVKWDNDLQQWSDSPRIKRKLPHDI